MRYKITTFISFIAVWLTVTNLPAQTRSKYTTSEKVPVFKTSKDSINYAITKLALDKARQDENTTEETFDSLQQKWFEIMETGILKYRTIYYPNYLFTSSDSITNHPHKEQIEEISISEKKDIPKTILLCPNVKKIELVNTEIKRLPSFLNKLKHLEEIEILNNKPTRKLRLSKNKSVKSLIIHAEFPDKLPSSYKKYTNLEKLDLSECGLKKFPTGAARNKKLKELSLQYNDITLLHDKLKPHRQLEKLALQYNKITSVPASIQNFPNVKKLTFNHNPITSVDEAVGNLQDLEFISFYNNKLTYIPPCLYKLRSLQVIDLFYNEIERLDTTLSQWKKLEILYLSNNKLYSLPDNLDDLSALVGLYVSHNRIDKIPESVGNMKTITVLKFNHNYLKAVPNSILALENLEELDISNNFITDISPRLFDFANYKVFSLSNNPWSAETKAFLPKKVNELRARNVFVHVMGNQDSD